MLTNALQGVANIAIRCSISHGELTVEVEYTTPLFPKPVLLTFVLHSVRRTSATEDVVSLGRRIKELESQLTEMVALQKRVAEMEEATSDIVCMPGMLPIPNTVLTFLYIPDGSLPCTMNIGLRLLNSGHHLGYWPDLKINTSTQFSTTHLPSSIRNIKRLKKCQHVVLCNTSATSLDGIESIGCLPHLLSLNIVNVNNLTDISWITNCSRLQHLVLFGCSGVTDISPVRDLKHLTMLDIRETGVKNTDFLTNSRLTITK
ncbi:MAG: hypothetical protein EB127_27045 [Alphaproteobacteria bacterium]|nr:hypothetical protein [Alphaproteobacteria bacterium]